MENNFILCDIKKNGVATLTLNRLDCHNAFNEVVIQLLNDKLMQLENNSQVKILMLTANGKNFSAGADLTWMKKMIQYSEEENELDALALATMFKRLFNFSKPTICIVKGKTMGGGIGLPACCDIVIAEEKATFCFTEAKLGLIPATIAPYIIHAIGPRAAKFYFLTTNFFSAFEAKEMGLVHEIVPDVNLELKSQEVVMQLLKNGQHALQNIKKVFTKFFDFDNEALKETAKLIAKIRCSDEAQQRLAEFLDKRNN